MIRTVSPSFFFSKDKGWSSMQLILRRSIWQFLPHGYKIPIGANICFISEQRKL